MKRNRC